MPFVGSIIPSRLVNADQRVQQSQRTRDAERADKPGRFKRLLDETDLTTSGVETGEAIRAVADNQSEESHEDRREHGYYDPSGSTQGGPVHRSLDLEG